jgi:hypothetical protein
MPTNASPGEDETAGFIACYARLPHPTRREFWQAQTFTDKLRILAGAGGGEPLTETARRRLEELEREELEQFRLEQFIRLEQFRAACAQKGATP